MTALLRMTAGLILWAVGFCAIYALHGLGCARGWDGVALLGTSLHRVALIAMWLAFLAAALGIVAALRPADRTATIDRIGVTLALVGFASIAVTGLPVIAVPQCL